MEEITNQKLIRGLLDNQTKLLERIDDLEKRYQKLENDIPTGEQLVSEIKKESVTELYKPYIPAPLVFKKRRRGPGAPPILESEIVAAQYGSKSANQAAKRLGVSYPTYRKYAKLYGKHTLLNPTAVGIKKMYSPHKGKYPIDDLLAGKHPDHPLYKIKDKLIRAGLKKPQCEQCGYCERRITDQKIPLLLIFDDGNILNRDLNNMKVWCYNCSFTSGKIWVKTKDRKTKKIAINDPDRIQGSPEEGIARF